MTTAAADGSIRDKEIFKGKRINLVLREVRAKNGAVLEREVVVHPGAVIILPVLADGRIVMIRNVRHTVNEELWELPAGTLDRGPGSAAVLAGEPPEDPRECAGRELAEETGYMAKTIRPYGWFYTSPGIITEKMHAFIATGLTAGPQQLEENEDITTCPLATSELWRMIQENKIVDGKTLAVLLKYMMEGTTAGERRG